MSETRRLLLRPTMIDGVLCLPIPMPIQTRYLGRSKMASHMLTVDDNSLVLTRDGSDGEVMDFVTRGEVSYYPLPSKIIKKFNLDTNVVLLAGADYSGVLTYSIVDKTNPDCFDCGLVENLIILHYLDDTERESCEDFLADTLGEAVSYNRFYRWRTGKASLSTDATNLILQVVISALYRHDFISHMTPGQLFNAVALPKDE